MALFVSWDRDDFQVKIRGYRIELGDIETAVAQHPAVAHNVCTAHEESPGERRLVSYIVAPTQLARTLPPAAELRAYLRALLPDYMVPASLHPPGRSCRCCPTARSTATRCLLQTVRRSAGRRRLHPAAQ